VVEERRLRRDRSTAVARSFCAATLLAACSTGGRGASTTGGHGQPQPARTAVIRRHPPIVEGRSEVGPFVRAGCKDLDTHLDCAGAEPIRSLGCSILRPDPDLAALGRRIPLAACVEESTHAHPWRIPGPGVREFGCMEQTRIHYVVARGGKLARLSTPEEFRAAYAPIGTPAEAAGLVLALTGATRHYKPSKDHVVQVDEFDDAFAEPTREGFKVHLFETHSCGCGAHPRYEVDYLVSPAGAVSIGAKRVIDEMPAGRACID
jgi:hypothetical protein